MKRNPLQRNVVWAASTVSAAVLVLGYHTSTSSQAAAASSSAVAPATGSSTSSGTTSSGSTTGTSDGSTGSTGASGSSSFASSAGSSSSASSGSDSSSGSTVVTGSVASTRWGDVQVAITVTDGKITAVSVPEYPTGNGRDQQINANALPILVQETVAAQSANIDMVSGATVTSDGYVQSLQSALDQAGLS